MQPTQTHLMLMRSILNQGWPAELLDILLRRCSAEQTAWQDLVVAGWVYRREQRWELTKEGKRAYNRRPKHLYF